VATASGVVFDQAWDAALGSGDDAHWSPLPELGPYLRDRARAVRQLVVIADQQGAQVRQEVVAEQHEPREVDAEVVEGGAAESAHKPRGGALSHKQIQRRADEAVSQNAKDLVAHVGTQAAEFQPRVLVLAGEVQARATIRDHLPTELSEILVETDHGGRDVNASDEALVEVLLQTAGDESERGARRISDRLGEALAHGQAVQGHESVAYAAEIGAVDTLVFEDEAAAVREAFLLRACAATDSSFDLAQRGTDLEDGVAALLRFPLPAR
jgi:hypothetical protein